MKNYRIIASGDTAKQRHGDDPYDLLKIFRIRPDRNPLVLEGPGGEVFTFHKVGATTGQRYTLAEITFQPGPGPFPHIHHYENEWLYIAEGAVQVAMGENHHPEIDDVPGATSPKDVLNTEIIGPGTLVYLPRYHVHTFSNHGLTQARMYAVWAPSGIENFFQAQVGLTPEEVSQMAPQYGLTFSSAWDQYVEQWISGGSTHTSHNNLEEFVELLSTRTAGQSDEAPQIKAWERTAGIWQLVPNET